MGSKLGLFQHLKTITNRYILKSTLEEIEFDQRFLPGLKSTNSLLLP